MQDAMTSFLTYFGIDVSQLPDPVKVVLAVVLLGWFLGAVLDIFSHLFRR